MWCNYILSDILNLHRNMRKLNLKKNYYFQHILVTIQSMLLILFELYLMYKWFEKIIKKVSYKMLNKII